MCRLIMFSIWVCVTFSYTQADFSLLDKAEQKMGKEDSQTFKP